MKENPIDALEKMAALLTEQRAEIWTLAHLFVMLAAKVIGEDRKLSDEELREIFQMFLDFKAEFLEQDLCNLEDTNPAMAARWSRWFEKKDLTDSGESAGG